MENIQSNILSVTVDDSTKSLKVSYDNGAEEVFTVGRDMFSKMHDAWLKEQPPFISDLYKLQMRNIILATINNNEKCVNDLSKFFSHNNEAEIMKFIQYMRKRDLSQEKSKWTPVAK